MHDSLTTLLDWLLIMFQIWMKNLPFQCCWTWRKNIYFLWERLVLNYLGWLWHKTFLIKSVSNLYMYIYTSKGKNEKLNDWTFIISLKQSDFSCLHMFLIKIGLMQIICFLYPITLLCVSVFVEIHQVYPGEVFLSTLWLPLWFYRDLSYSC